jgi:hypothetical protein
MAKKNRTPDALEPATLAPELAGGQDAGDENDATPQPDAASAPAPDPDPAQAPVPAPAQATQPSREDVIRNRLAEIGDPWAERRAINDRLLRARQEREDYLREMAATIGRLEDQHRDAEERARWIAEEQRVLGIELAGLERDRQSAQEQEAANQKAKAARAAVEADLAKLGIAP